VGSTEVRRGLSAAVMLMLVFGQVALMLQFSDIHSNPADYFGPQWFGWMLAPALYFTLCTALGTVFNTISRKLNDFEIHPTKVSASVLFGGTAGFDASFLLLNSFSLRPRQSPRWW
jgi:hypothetical protein